ncbi:hypothetical protein AJ85_17445 [Alkalihalobacillus alcalophilus ATCC 27647 = CGMCC 1.3604]|uniref:Uncharacterized protein n=1 Tax=Alkalihalobacillus alcalophilus ATCC 27647 = CGMCC 1.3604 TaxID=1218173 RepID=A0A094XBD5_ALKAL|nr:hypothetical protein [Alkalihalobacillus alcalophilus]KGA96120.1 hypothetical protein BALCAV_0218190 [Alkalihalobacillus alcalophilus ATCC 27647 = CGMCC 1.3604]MED1564310.1 hypothetical protein [Alkalihalobacillus alcalophilus]THG92071.1 hypothetical protein AJ85_17445 [Alkalihalobacillus alcalophilus ATCC 27647 = CGMCC 1.3604]
MNTFRGPFRLIWEDMRFQFYIMTLVTAILFAFYLFLGMVMQVEGMTGALFGPFYGFLLFYPFQIFVKTYPTFMAFGGTRKQFLIGNFIVSGIFIVISMFILNVMHQLNQFLYEQGLNTNQLIHMAGFSASSNALFYFWVDVLWGIFAIGLGVLIASVWYYFGAVKMMLGGAVLSLVGLSWWMFGNVDSVIQFVFESHFAFLHIVAGVGVVFAYLSYLLMKNGPLERGGHSLSLREREKGVS